MQPFTKTIQPAHTQHKLLGPLLCPTTLLFCLLTILLSACGNTTGPGKLTLQQAPANQLVYVALGASDTFGIGAEDPTTENWPADLAALLGPQVRVVNLGIPNIDAARALHSELPVAIAAHPQLVTIWLAVNDLADQVPIASYEQSLDQIVGQLQQADPGVRIAVANVPDLIYLPHFQSWNQQALLAQISAYNAAIAAVTQRHHVLLVDLYQRWQELATHPEYISDDGFHPSTLGYARLAQIFYSVLQSKS